MLDGKESTDPEAEAVPSPHSPAGNPPDAFRQILPHYKAYSESVWKPSVPLR